jgi:hypothetical protein
LLLEELMIKVIVKVRLVELFALTFSNLHVKLVVGGEDIRKIAELVYSQVAVVPLIDAEVIYSLNETICLETTELLNVFAPVQTFADARISAIEPVAPCGPSGPCAPCGPCSPTPVAPVCPCAPVVPV